MEGKLGSENDSKRLYIYCLFLRMALLNADARRNEKKRLKKAMKAMPIAMLSTIVKTFAAIC